jgi:predicted ATPase
MPFVAIAGSPGAGKTTLLVELARRGHKTVSDSAREVIAGRKARGLSPRPDPVEFAQEVYRRDLAKYRSFAGANDIVFFERTAIESRAMLLDALRQAGNEVDIEAQEFEFVDPVFVLPPWQDIYRTDEERDHTFEHALWVHEQVVGCYLAQGYEVNEVPRCSPSERTDYVLASLSNRAA